MRKITSPPKILPTECDLTAVYYGEIKKNDIANGYGVRVSLFVSGCRNACENCFNRQTWAFDYGKPFTEETVAEIISLLAPDFVAGLSLLGGEPFEPENQPELLKLTSAVKNVYPEKDIWCYTGFRLEQLLGQDANCRAVTESTLPLLENIDILVDGRYVESLHDISLQFRGSSNQRVIDLKKSLNGDCIHTWRQLRK